jgi:hypothetical protein
MILGWEMEYIVRTNNYISYHVLGVSLKRACASVISRKSPCRPTSSIAKIAREHQGIIDSGDEVGHVVFKRTRAEELVGSANCNTESW